MNYSKHNFFCKSLLEQEAKDSVKNALLLVLVVLCLVWLTGCTVHVYPKVIDTADAVCKNNGKIYFIASDPFSEYARVYCNNGANFYIKHEDTK